MDKWYLQDLSNRNINTVETRYISSGETKSLDSLINETGWKEVILKPTIAGAARHTYRVNIQTISEYEDIFRELISNEDMMLQPFQYNIMKKGEISFMVIGGKFTHAVLKKGKEGDFRVQDDFGGTLHEYHPSNEEIRFSEEVVLAYEPLPAYARVDAMWDNNGNLAVSEVEMIEPELWFRRNENAAQKLAEVIAERINY
jgi:glutathione synthase/RimK-type ligase-like ATP-grasp enzyme